MSETLSDEQIAKMAREATWVGAQASTEGALLYLLQHETEEVVEQGLMHAIRDLRELQRLRATTGPTRAQIEALRRSPGLWNSTWNDAIDAVIALFPADQEGT
jgi:hypothetical protein